MKKVRLPFPLPLLREHLQACSQLQTARGFPPRRGLRGHPAGTMTQLAGARGSPAAVREGGREARAGLAPSYLGTQFGEEPSISQVANRFMGTGLFSAPPPKLSRPLRSAMVRDGPTPSCGSGHARRRGSVRGSATRSGASGACLRAVGVLCAGEGLRRAAAGPQLVMPTTLP